MYVLKIRPPKGQQIFKGKVAFFPEGRIQNLLLRFTDLKLLGTKLQERPLFTFVKYARIMKFYVIKILMLSQQSGAINNKAISNFWSSISFPFSFDGLPVSAIVILDSKEWTSGRVHVSQTLLIFKVIVSKRRCEIYFRSNIFQKSCRNSPFLYIYFYYYLHLT